MEVALSLMHFVREKRMEQFGSKEICTPYVQTEDQLTCSQSPLGPIAFRVS